MTEKNSLINRLKIKLKKKVGNPKYGEVWPSKNNLWYEKIHDENFLLHKDFINYIKSKNDISSVLEIGCGTGIYPIKNSELFKNMSYTGIDISPSAIDFCKTHSDFNFLCGDFIKMELGQKFDLVYSHAVIDHVYNIDEFVSKIVKLSKKYVYINSYRGYFPELKKHKMKWDGNDACYFNDISIIKISELLTEIGLKKSEFLCRSQQSGQQIKNLDNQLVIEIMKNS